MKKDLENLLGAENIDFRISNPLEIAEYLHEQGSGYKANHGGIIIPLSYTAKDTILTIYFADDLLRTTKPENLKGKSELIRHEILELRKGTPLTSVFLNNIEQIYAYENSAQSKYKLKFFESHKLSQLWNEYRTQIPLAGISEGNDFMQTPKQALDRLHHDYRMWLNYSIKIWEIQLKNINPNYKPKNHTNCSPISNSEPTDIIY